MGNPWLLPSIAFEIYRMVPPSYKLIYNDLSPLAIVNIVISTYIPHQLWLLDLKTNLANELGPHPGPPCRFLWAFRVQCSLNPLILGMKMDELLTCSSLDQI